MKSKKSKKKVEVLPKQGIEKEKKGSKSKSSSDGLKYADVIDASVTSGESPGVIVALEKDGIEEPKDTAVEVSGAEYQPAFSGLKRYLEDISKYPLLTPEEEFELATKLKQTGDIQAAKRMVSANLRLVVKIAMEYRNAYQNVLDLIQEGNIGLMKAVSRFDPTKGAKLSYYASWWIRSYILKYILDNFRLVRVGTTQAQKKLFFHLMREKERLEAQGIHAGPKLLADRLHVREKDIIEMEQRIGSSSSEMSLDQPVYGSEDSSRVTTQLDLLEGHDDSADTSLEAEQLKQILQEHIDEFKKTLSDKELAIFEERLYSENPKTLQEVADLFGLTRERVRQIESKVIEKLQAFYRIKGIMVDSR
ncbi:MAG: RNA polymerase sigma factor RpoD/SigA [Bacteriovoracia bacterium]